MIFYRVAYADLKKKLPKLTPDDYQKKYQDLKKNFGSGDPKIHFNDAKQTIEIEHFGEDFLIFNRNLANALKSAFPYGEGSTPQIIEAAFATPEAAKRKVEILEQSRDALRELPYLDAPSTTPPIDSSQSALDNLKALSNADPKGVCFGGGHGDEVRNKVMMDLFDDPGHGGMNLFFIEELGVGDQQMVDDYLATPVGTPIPDQLMARIKSIKGMDAILAKMRDHNAANPRDKLKAFGINSAEAKSRDGLMGLENRVAMMNAIAKAAMDKAIKDNPGQKFMAFIGAAHSNTHPGGVPGLAQVMGVPAVKLDDNGKLQLDTENKSLRGMPSKVELKRIELAAAKLEKDPAYKALSQDQRHDKLQEMIRQARVETFLKLDTKGRAEHLKRFQAMGGGVISDDEMAEQIVIEAEAAALAADPAKDGSISPEVKASKHKQLVADLTTKLKALSPDKKSDPRSLMTSLAKAVSGGSQSSFYKKDGAKKSGSKHVSIDVKQAQRTWLAKLAQL